MCGNLLLVFGVSFVEHLRPFFKPEVGDPGLDVFPVLQVVSSTLPVHYGDYPLVSHDHVVGSKVRVCKHSTLDAPPGSPRQLLLLMETWLGVPFVVTYEKFGTIQKRGSGHAGTWHFLKLIRTETAQ